MKTVFAILIIAFSFSKARAMSDIDKAILYGANASSGGTLLPAMEAEMQKIQLEFEKQKAAFRLNLEKDYRANLESLISSGIVQLHSLLEKSEAQLGLLNEERVSFNQIVTLVNELYDSSVTLVDIQNHLELLSKNIPNRSEEHTSELQSH